jgi:uncharacterized membrane protein
VTVPIGCFVAAVACDIISIWAGPVFWAQMATWLILFGLLSALFAASLCLRFQAISAARSRTVIWSVRRNPTFVSLAKLRMCQRSVLQSEPEKKCA